MEKTIEIRETKIFEINLAEQYNAGFAFANDAYEWPWFVQRECAMTDNTVKLIMEFGERYHFYVPKFYN